MSAYQEELGRLLKLSTLTPAHYAPSDEIKTLRSVAVCVDGEPILLTGPADDDESAYQAQALCHSQSFRQALNGLDLAGELSCRSFEGKEIAWCDEHVSVATSKSGDIEKGGEAGDLVLILVGCKADNRLATWMCVNTEIARIMDPSVPELDDGVRLSSLARQYAGSTQ